MALTAHLLKSDLSPEKMESAALPLSPTASPHGGQMPQGFDDLVTHNNTTSYPREQIGLERHIQADSRMSTPASHAMSPDTSPYGLPHPQQQSVYANNYAYQNHAVYDNRDGSYQSFSEEVRLENNMKLLLVSN